MAQAETQSKEFCQWGQTSGGKDKLFFDQHTGIFCLQAVLYLELYVKLCQALLVTIYGISYYLRS